MGDRTSMGYRYESRYGIWDIYMGYGISIWLSTISIWSSRMSRQEVGWRRKEVRGMRDGEGRREEGGGRRRQEGGGRDVPKLLCSVNKNNEPFWSLLCLPPSRVRRCDNPRAECCAARCRASGTRCRPPRTGQCIRRWRRAARQSRASGAQGCLRTGAYARPLFSSTSAVSDRKYILHTPC